MKRGCFHWLCATVLVVSFAHGAHAQVCQVVTDGGFEGGTPNASWAETSTNFGSPICDLFGCGDGAGTVGPRSGDWWAWFGGIAAAAESASVEQTVTIPSGTATLRFYLWIGASSGNATDNIRALLDGNVVFSATEGDATYTSGYTLVQVDVSAFADGASHLLRIDGTTTGSPDLSNFSVDDVSIEVCVAGYVLDGFGGVHTVGSAAVMSPATPYFGFDVARDLELASTGFYVLDGFGGIHAGGGASPMSPATPYFGFDIAKDIELASTGFHVLDGFGGLHAGGGASPLSPATTYFGFDIARDLELAPTGFYVLDGFGGVHPGGGASSISPATTYFGFDIARDFELGPTGVYVLDGLGGIHTGGGAPVMSPATTYFGFDAARDFEIALGGFQVLDGFGAIHTGGSATAMTPGPPYFGFDVAEDLELR